MKCLSNKSMVSFVMLVSMSMLLLVSGGCGKSDGAPDDIEARRISLIKNSERAICHLSTKKPGKKSRSKATGFFINGKGHILTNWHVVAGVLPGSEITATIFKNKKPQYEYTISNVLGENKDKDLIILSADTRSSVPYLEIVNKKIKVGETILVMGYPKGYPMLVASMGIISAVTSEAVWMTAPVSTGSSGSPVMTMSGEVIGIHRGHVPEAQNLNEAVFGIDIEYSKSPVPLSEWLESNNPIYYSGKVKKGDERYQKKKFQSALDNYKLAETYYPEDGKLKIKLGKACYCLRRYHDAYKYFDKAAGLEYARSDPLLQKTVEKWKQKSLEKAREWELEFDEKPEEVKGPDTPEMEESPEVQQESGEEMQ